jgi:hypothetical protein
MWKVIEKAKQKKKKNFTKRSIMRFLKTFMGVQFVDHRLMLKLLPRSVTGQCSMMGCFTLHASFLSKMVLAWQFFTVC